MPLTPAHAGKQLRITCRRTGVGRNKGNLDWNHDDGYILNVCDDIESLFPNVSSFGLVFMTEINTP